jgi:ubiquitin-conjugating enzyme E2 J2
MASKGAFKRLTKEFLTLQKQPIPYIIAKPLDGNILEWHYVITGTNQ